MTKRRYKLVVNHALDFIECGDLEQSFHLLKDGLKPDSRRSRQLRVIRSDYNKIKKSEISGIEKFDDLRVYYSQISKRTIDFIYTLSKKHFIYEYRVRVVVEASPPRIEMPESIHIRR